MSKVFIASAARTAIGNFGGALLKSSPVELGRVAALEALKRAGINSDSAQDVRVDEVISGNVLGAGHGMNMSRQVALRAGLPVSTPAYTVNKVCGSGLKAVTLAANEIASGQAEIILAGGTESMSQAGFISMHSRWGSRLGHAALADLILQDGLTDVFHSCHMGITAENLAQRFEISRQAQDQFACDSQKKAVHAISQGWFKDEIAPVAIAGKAKGTTMPFEVDEYPRAETNLESLAKLNPAFKKDGTVTAGNASGINDGAAYLVLASESALKKLGATPLAEVVGWASGAVEPEVMGIGPVEAVRKLCNKTGVSLGSIDLIEANEAFAAQALAVNKLLEWDTNRVNVCGGAIALGHPIGASGARILVTLLYQMKRLGKRTGIATLCVGGGQGIAVMVKR